MLTEARLSVTFSTAEDILKAEDTEKGFLFFFFCCCRFGFFVEVTQEAWRLPFFVVKFLLRLEQKVGKKLEEGGRTG